MTDHGSNSESVLGSERTTAQHDYTVGYGRPPTHSRFKPGKSGNPKGRRKGARNLNAHRRELYLSLVQVRDGDKIKKVPRALAVDVAILNRALRGEPKAAQLADKIAKELGVYDEGFPAQTGYPMDLTDEQVAMLSDEDLDTMIQIMKKVDGIARRS
jgi:hypothetical protein